MQPSLRKPAREGGRYRGLHERKPARHTGNARIMHESCGKCGGRGGGGQLRPKERERAESVTSCPLAEVGSPPQQGPTTGRPRSPSARAASRAAATRTCGRASPRPPPKGLLGRGRRRCRRRGVTPWSCKRRRGGRCRSPEGGRKRPVPGKQPPTRRQRAKACVWSRAAERKRG